MRILLVKRDKIGDLVLTTPLLAHLRSALPQAQIHLLANDYNAWVVHDQPGLDRLWIYPRVRHGGRVRIGAALRHVPLAIALRHARFDWAIAMNGEESPRAVHRTLGVRARRTVAYVNDAARYGRRLTDALPVPERGHEIERLAALLGPLGVRPPAAWSDVRCAVPARERAAAHAWLANRGLVAGGFILLGLGARWPQKQPTAAQVVRWATAWHTRWGLPAVLSWTPGDRRNPLYPGDDAIAHEALAQELPFLHPFVGSLGTVAALAHAARTTVVPDSGLMHVAAASAGGVLGLFAAAGGHDDPQRWHPLGARAHWLVAPDTVAALPDAPVHEALAALVDARAAVAQD